MSEVNPCYETKKTGDCSDCAFVLRCKEAVFPEPGPDPEVIRGQQQLEFAYYLIGRTCATCHPINCSLCLVEVIAQHGDTAEMFRRHIGTLLSDAMSEESSAYQNIQEAFDLSSIPYQENRLNEAEALVELLQDEIERIGHPTYPRQYSEAELEQMNDERQDEEDPFVYRLGVCCKCGDPCAEDRNVCETCSPKASGLCPIDESTCTNPEGSCDSCCGDDYEDPFADE